MFIPLLVDTTREAQPLQVSEHNKRNAKGGQLLGQKAQAVRNILEHYDAEARDLLISFSIELGHEQTPWTDDCLSSKKCLPGYQPFVRSKHVDQKVLL